MKIVRYTLLTDGSSDSVLIPIINWTISQHCPNISVLPQFARNLGNVGLNLAKRIPAAIQFFPCDLLFVHRDAELQSYDERLNEITAAIYNYQQDYVPIIPMRMTEAWLLSNIAAIRDASGNKSSTIDLQLPAKRNWESLPNPKQVLFNALITASEKSGRALKKFSPDRQRARVTELTQDFSTLRGLRSFDLFEAELIKKLKDI